MEALRERISARCIERQLKAYNSLMAIIMMTMMVTMMILLILMALFKAVKELLT
jgi:hypothetical protein